MDGFVHVQTMWAYGGNKDVGPLIINHAVYGQLHSPAATALLVWRPLIRGSAFPGVT
jgi:hypothetical protein